MPTRYVFVWLCPVDDGPAIERCVSEAHALGAVLCDVVYRQVLALADNSNVLVHALVDYMEHGTVCVHTYMSKITCYRCCQYRIGTRQHWSNRRRCRTIVNDS